MSDPFADEQIEHLTAEINRQLLQLGAAEPAGQKSASPARRMAVGH